MADQRRQEFDSRIEYVARQVEAMSPAESAVFWRSIAEDAVEALAEHVPLSVAENLLREIHNGAHVVNGHLSPFESCEFCRPVRKRHGLPPYPAKEGSQE